MVTGFLCVAVYLEDSFIKSGVFSVTELVRVSRSKSLANLDAVILWHSSDYYLSFRFERGDGVMSLTLILLKQAHMYANVCVHFIWRDEFNNLQFLRTSED